MFDSVSLSLMFNKQSAWNKISLWCIRYQCGAVSAYNYIIFGRLCSPHDARFMIRKLQRDANFRFIQDLNTLLNYCLICVKTLLIILPRLRWRHNERDSVSNHLPHHCLLNRLFTRRSKKTSKLRVTGLCAGNSPETGEFPAQRDSYAENGSIWWRLHENRLSMR